jgi:hypothetical protein
MLYFYTTIIFICIILVIIQKIFYFIWNFYKSRMDTIENRYKTDLTEIIPNINYRHTLPQNTHHLFWNGGYKSTFRLCEILLMLNKPVQPIYIMNSKIYENTKKSNKSQQFIININENDKKKIEEIYLNDIKNENQEIETMKRIREIILKNNPHIKNKFLPTHYVISVEKNNEISKSIMKLQLQIGYISKKFLQYEYMTKFSTKYPFPIEITIDLNDDGLIKLIENIKIGYGNHCRINEDNNCKELKIFENFRFPISHLTTNDLKKIAVKNAFLYILDMCMKNNN